MSVYAHTCVGTGTRIYVMCVCACGSLKLTLDVCLVSISIDVVKHHEQKQLGEEGFISSYISSTSLKNFRTGIPAGKEPGCKN